MNSKIKNIKLDIRDLKIKRIFNLKTRLRFHLVAQSLVKQSYIDPNTL